MWIIDTEATNHMVFRSDMFLHDSVSKFKEPKKFYLPNGEISQVTHMGFSTLSTISIITNVFYIHEFKYNLLSVCKITKELGCSFIFFPYFCVFQELYSGKVKKIDKEERGLYLLLKHLSLQMTSFFVSESYEIRS